jgi:transcriptional regulator with XRE-family HTH domain
MHSMAVGSVERGNRVRLLREDRLMSREELARRARVSLRTIWSVESGNECRLETKRAILRALGVSRRRHRFVFPGAVDRVAQSPLPPDAPSAGEIPRA